MTTAPERSALGSPIAVDRWPSEQPLFALSLVLSTLIWIVLAVTLIGIAYAALFGLVFFFMHVGFVAHVRGNGVRLGPAQFPDLHTRVADLSRRMGMERVPETYLIQAGGSLNALATRFLRTHMVILFSDLLEACGDDHAARDMIVGHELGHIRAGHLRWRWFLLPSSLVPFLGGALSRAREYTCDRFGLAAAGGRDGALLGLTILAAGPTHGRLVNRQAMVRQRVDLDTGWMTLGEWLSTHPPLAKRLVALDPSLGVGSRVSAKGPVRALLIVLALTLGLGGALGAAVVFVGKAARATAAAAQATGAGFATPGAMSGPALAEARAELESTVTEVAAFLSAERAAGRALPDDFFELQDRWMTAYPGREAPMDPFDGNVLGYTPAPDGSYRLWSSGPDGSPGTSDDLVYQFDA